MPLPFLPYSRVVRLRRRGKEIIEEPYVANSNVHNEIGRVQVERRTPFRGATTDVGQCGVRCNLDFQFMPRAPVLAVDVTSEEESRNAQKPDDGQGKEQSSSSSAEKPDDGRSADRPADEPHDGRGKKHSVSSKKTVTYDRAEAFYGIRQQLATDAAMRQAAHSMLAMWQAAHNTDYC